MALRSRSRRIKATLGILAAIAAVPVGYAVAQGTDAPVTDDNSRLSAAEAEANGFTPEPAPNGPDSIPDGMNQIGKALPPQLVGRCEANPSAQEDCGLVLAMTEGKIPPGMYSNEELEAAVADAGYTLSVEALGE